MMPYVLRFLEQVVGDTKKFALLVVLGLLFWQLSVFLEGHWIGGILWLLIPPMFVIAAIVVVGTTIEAIWKKEYGRFLASKFNYFCLTIFTVATLNAIEPLPRGAYLLWFDQNDWKSEYAWGVSSPTKRRLMLGSLYWFKLWNKTEDEILQMLGDDEEKFKYLVEDSASQRVISYRIDNEDGVFGIDSQWLVLFIDTDSRLEKVEILTD